MAAEVDPLHAIVANIDIAAPELRLHRASSLRPLPFREGRLAPWLLAAFDVAAVQLALSVARTLQTALAPWWEALRHHAPSEGARLGLLLIPLGYCLAGLYPGYGLDPVERLRRRITSVVLVFGGLVAWDNAVNRNEWSRGILLLTFAVTVLAAAPVEAAAICLLMRLGRWGAPAVVLSHRRAGIELARTLLERRELGLVPVAVFGTSAELWGMTVEGVPVIGPPAMAGTLARRVSIAAVAMPGLRHADLINLVERLPFRRVIVVPELAGLQSLWVTPRDLGGSLGLELVRNLAIRRNYYLKRAMDYALGVPLFLLSVPMVAVLALWIKRVSPGPAFYAQQREGRHGKPIRVWKLRTMYRDADAMLERHLAAHPDQREQWQRFFKLQHDPRVLPRVGRLLRKTSLDELPQLWNVLRGQLSLVGPRPFPGYHMASFGGDFRVTRRSVLPGITGLWQISARSNGDLQVQERLDTYYIRNWSPWLDTYILARTIVIVLRCSGAY